MIAVKPWTGLSDRLEDKDKKMMYQKGASEVVLDGTPVRDNVLLVLLVRWHIVERDYDCYSRDSDYRDPTDSIEHTLRHG